MESSTRLLRLLQLTDSAFPTGAYAFSHGLEGLVTAGVVTSEGVLAEIVAAHLREGFAGVECPAVAHAWRAARAGDLQALIELDATVDALKPVPAFRIGSVRTGRRLLESAAGVLAGAVLAGVLQQARDGTMAGHHSLAFGVVMEAAGADERTASLALGAGFVNGLTASAVRLGICGAGAAQRLVAALHEDIAVAAERARQTEIDDMGSYLPMIDIMGLRQPALVGRVFAS